MKKNDGSNQGNTPGNIKGMISYPCCPKQSAIVYEGAHGSASIQCSNCRKFLLLDYDTMTATITKPCRGAAARFKAAESA